MMETYPDWTPSLQLGHTEIMCTNTAHSARQRKREQRKNTRSNLKQMNNTLWMSNTRLKEAVSNTLRMRQEAGDGEQHIEDETQEAGKGEQHTEEETQEAGDGEQHTEEETNNIKEMAVTQTECNFCVHRCADINCLLEENRQLRRELDESRMSDSLDNDHTESTTQGCQTWEPLWPYYMFWCLSCQTKRRKFSVCFKRFI